MRESAAAWGAALNLIPSLGPVIEGYLQKEEGKRLIRAIKDPQQQEFFIQSWQQSSVFKSFFGDEESPDTNEATEGGEVAFAPSVVPPPGESSAVGGASSVTASGPPSYLPPPPSTAADGNPNLDLFNIHMPPSVPPPPQPTPSLTFSPNQHLHPQLNHQPPPLPYDPKLESLLHSHPGQLSHSQDPSMQNRSDGMGGVGGMHTSLSDIVARDAARA
ncbi:hypothetical protein SEUCBS140593_001177 [Sporothrix eucalyptigena]|uniref:Uncharacterized protein n=1 Tax=Sporothrix eucalyptigena TaxID=1812306 RepID=A0ABP0AWF1_9PEZI